MRYGPYEDKHVEHELYQDIIDEILKTLIQKGKGIEVNTSGYALNKTCGFPNFDIVKRYKELGGTIITVGTDSHTSDRVGEHVEDVLKHYHVNSVTTEEYIDMMKVTQAVRPKNSQLSKEKLAKVGINFPKWEDGLKRYLKEEGVL